MMCFLFANGQSTNLGDSLSSKEPNELRATSEVLEMQLKQLELNQKVELLKRDTHDLKTRVKLLEAANKQIQDELEQYQKGVFFGLGFGFNFFINSPPKYFIKPDSTIGSYGESNGVSFILSGFMAYKLDANNSLIFNVPLGDVTNREEFKIGLFNQKMAGGIGYGRNIGNISMILIVNMSPSEYIELDIIQQEKFEEEKYSKVNPSNYPSTTRYSPSFTIGFSYNFKSNDRLRALERF